MLFLALSAAGSPFYDATQYTTRVATVPNGLLDRVTVPGGVPLDVVHVYGTARERGKAHGQLLSARLLHFVNVELPTFYVQEIDGLPIDKLPKWLQDAIQALAAHHAVEAFDVALKWLEGVQHGYNNVSAAAVYEEIDAIAEGACDASAVSGATCDAAALAATLRSVNVLPDLIRMQCSMLGAWGGATPGGGLLQMRSLDFGGGPFANATVLLVHHPSASVVGGVPAEPFASLSWPGFAGVITGFTPRLSLSEKVNDLHGGGIPPGTYHGQTTALVLRDVLQLAQDSKELAVRMMQAAHRTWGVWLGVGDAASQRMTVVRYEEASVTPFNASSLPRQTGQPAIADVVYVDKHPQPSTDDTMPAMVQTLAAARNVTAVNAAALCEATQSGDVHIALYEYAPKHLAAVSLALGSTDANGTYDGPGGRKAYAAPYVRFDAVALFATTPLVES